MDINATSFAKENFDKLRQALDERKWHYDTDEEDYSVSFKVNGDDLLLDFQIRVDKKRDLVVLYSRLPFKVSKERAVQMAQAVNHANTMLAEGSFDYNYKSGFLCYRLTNSFRGSVLSASVYDRMISMAGHTVDDYNEKFLLLSLGAISLEACKKMIEE